MPILVHKGMVVGAVSCKEKIVGCQKTLYIQSLGVLPLFRVQGIGSSLLDMAESYAEELRVDTITLHVHTRNEAAISLYKKKGFDIKETLPHYYPRLQPSSAHLMAKRL